MTKAEKTRIRKESEHNVKVLKSMKEPGFLDPNTKVIHVHSWKKCKILVRGQDLPVDMNPPDRVRTHFTKIFAEYWTERCTACPAVKRPWFGYGMGKMRYGSVKNP